MGYYHILHNLRYHQLPSIYTRYLPLPPLSHIPRYGILPPFISIGFQFHFLGWMVHSDTWHFFFCSWIKLQLFNTWYLQFSFRLMLGQFRYPALFIGHPPLLLLSLAFTCDHYKWHYSGQSRGDKFDLQPRYSWNCLCLTLSHCSRLLENAAFPMEPTPCSKVLVITPEDFTWSFLSSLSKNNKCISAYHVRHILEWDYFRVRYACFLHVWILSYCYDSEMTSFRHTCLGISLIDWRGLL